VILRCRLAAGALVLAVVWTRPTPAAEVLKLRPTATLYADEKGVSLSVPQGVGCGGGTTFVVADSGRGRVLRFEVSGALAQTKGEVALPELPYPIRADVDAKGSIIVLDGKSRRIGRVGSDGTFAGWVDVPAAQGSGAAVLRSFALDTTGRIFALDIAGWRVAVIGPGGALERSIGIPQDAGFPTDLTVDSHGTVFVVDGRRCMVYAARKDDKDLSAFSKSLAEDLDYPSAIATDGAGHFFVADENGGGIVILGPDGSFRGRQSAYGWKDGYLRYPSGLCTNGRGILVVADRENQRVQVFSVGE
jgi:sugar lactone lactonase YvrE